jgi:hypothetical protein
MGLLKYAVHAYAWTGSWSNDTLDIIENVKELGVDPLVRFSHKLHNTGVK